MTIENEKRFLLLLSSALCGTGASKADVLDYIESHHWMVLTDKDKMIKHNRNELVWRNDLAFVRKHLAQEQLFVDGIRNDWSITDKGKVYLSILYRDVLHASNLLKISHNLMTALEDGRITF